MKTLVIKHGALGDIFMMLGAIQDIASASGGPVDVLTSPAYVKIFKRSKDVSNVFTDQRKSFIKLGYLLELRKLLNSSEYSTIIDLQNTRRTLRYRRWLAPKIRWCQLGPIAPAEFRSERSSSPVVAKIEHQLRVCGYSPDSLLNGSINWLCESTAASEELKASSRTIILLPGASARHTEKIWPHYAELRRRLEEYGYHVFVAPGPDDMALCKEVGGRQLLENDSWLNFFQLAGVLEQADFVVGNDSGPTHLAASLGAKGLALFAEAGAVYSLNMKRRNMDVEIGKTLEKITVDQVIQHIREKVA